MLPVKIFFIVVIAVPLFGSPIDSKWKRLLQKCENLCMKSGGKPIYDLQTKSCKCKLGYHIYDSSDSLHKVKLIKRETAPVDPAPTTVPPHPTPSVAQPEAIVAQPEPIVGQQPPTSTTTRRPVRLRERTLSADQQHALVQQLRDRAGRIEGARDARARQQEIEAMRAVLRQLSQSQPPAVPTAPQRASRLRNAVEEARKQRTQRLMKPHLVGVALGKNVLLAPKEDKVVAQKPHFDIVTQDPSLVDE